MITHRARSFPRATGASCTLVFETNHFYMLPGTQFCDLSVPAMLVGVQWPMGDLAKTLTKCTTIRHIWMGEQGWIKRYELKNINRTLIVALSMFIQPQSIIFLINHSFMMAALCLMANWWWWCLSQVVKLLTKSFGVIGLIEPLEKWQFASSSNKPFFQGPSCLHNRLEACLSVYIPNSMEGNIQVQKPLELGGCIGDYRGHFLSKVSWIHCY